MVKYEYVDIATVDGADTPTHLEERFTNYIFKLVLHHYFSIF